MTRTAMRSWAIMLLGQSRLLLQLLLQQCAAGGSSGGVGDVPDWLRCSSADEFRGCHAAGSAQEALRRRSQLGQPPTTADILAVTHNHARLQLDWARRADFEFEQYERMKAEPAAGAAAKQRDSYSIRWLGEWSRNRIHSGGGRRGWGGMLPIEQH